MRGKLMLFALSLLSSSAFADDTQMQANAVKPKSQTIRSISPIFGQLVSLPFPRGFKPAFENTNGPSYVREAVLEGENVDKWTQMITVTGAKGLATKQELTPTIFATSMARGFQRSCPTSFSAQPLTPIQIGNYSGFAAWMSCGTAKPVGEPYSESMLLIVVKGESDYYTIQWAERAAASSVALKWDEAKWLPRFQALMPVKLCPIIPNEQPPYPSCIN